MIVRRTAKPFYNAQECRGPRATLAFPTLLLIAEDSPQFARERIEFQVRFFAQRQVLIGRLLTVIAFSNFREDCAVRRILQGRCID